MCGPKQEGYCRPQETNDLRHLLRLTALVNERGLLGRVLRSSVAQRLSHSPWKYHVALGTVRVSPA